MRRSRLIATATIAAAISLGIAGPAAAHPEHTSCKGFGEFFADYAQGGYADDFGLENPGLAPFATEPGIIAEVIGIEHDLFCE